MDAQVRLWGAQYRGDRIAMLDTKSGEFRQWDVAPKWSAPYDVALDKNGDAWTGSMLTHQVTRVNTRTYDEHPQGVRGQLDDAGDALGRLQPSQLSYRAKGRGQPWTKVP